MCKLLILLLLGFLTIESKERLQSFDERVFYTCIRCKKDLTQAEASLALLMAVFGKDPIFLCNACRKVQKGKEEDQLKEAIEGYRPHLAIVTGRELDGGYRSEIRQMPVVQDYLRKQHLKKERIAVVTPLGYRVIAQRHGKLPLLLVRSPLKKEYELKQIEIDLPVEEMTPLATNNILITTTQNADGSAFFYLYNPAKHFVRKLESGELLKEMEKCTQIVEGSKLLAQLVTEIQAKKQAKDRSTREDIL